MARILRAPLARADLLDLWTHIASESSSAIADTFLARIYGALEIVASAPYIGRERSEFPGSPRSIVVRPYVIFYEPLPVSRCGGCCMGRGGWRISYGDLAGLNSRLRRTLP